MQIDVARQLGAVVREVASREIEGKLARVVMASRSYVGAIDEVWDALTSPERIPRWFLPISGDLKVGGRYQLEGNAGGTITACEPPRRLAATWEFGGGVSWVTVLLTEEAPERTRLELEHAGHVEDEFWFQYGPGATGVGWDLTILGLALHLTGEMPGGAAEGAEWATTDEGKAFARGSSEAWRLATVAAGAMTPEEAAAAAERTSAFYTGEG
jgi:uncharacterized protein YndB with AHSA1/START domain